MNNDLSVWEQTIEAIDLGMEAQFDDGLDELVGFGTVVTEDKEVERFVDWKVGGLEADEHGFPVWTVKTEQLDVLCFNNMKYWTTQEGVFEDEATANDRSRWLGIDENPELPTYYSTAGEQRKWKVLDRRFHVIVAYIWANQTNKVKLAKAKARFWQRYFEAKKNKEFFLRPVQIGAIKNLFVRFGA